MTCHLQARKWQAIVFLYLKTGDLRLKVAKIFEFMQLLVYAIIYEDF